MTKNEQESLAVIALSAALIDGSKSETERAEVRQIFENLDLPSASGLTQQVLYKKLTWESAADYLTTAESRQLAFELAVCVCEADGLRNQEESKFLSALSSRLKLGESVVNPVLAQGDALATAAPLPQANHQPVSGGGDSSLSATRSEAVPSPGVAQSLGVAAMPESSIRNTAILAGALELLPQSMATLAILPVQTHLVYRVGKHYGYSLDGSHVKEFLAVGGLGLASQALEGLARKFLGGLAKKAGGSLLGGMVSGATGPAMTFGTTYAMGKLADRYYGQGRKLPLDQLRTTFQGLLGQAQGLGQTLLPQIQARSRSLSPFDLTKIAQGSLQQ